MGRRGCFALPGVTLTPQLIPVVCDPESWHSNAHQLDADQHGPEHDPERYQRMILVQQALSDMARSPIDVEKRKQMTVVQISFRQMAERRAAIPVDKLRARTRDTGAADPSFATRDSGSTGEDTVNRYLHETALHRVMQSGNTLLACTELILNHEQNGFWREDSQRTRCMVSELYDMVRTIIASWHFNLVLVDLWSATPRLVSTRASSVFLRRK